MNFMMADKRFSKDLRRKCRAFLMASRTSRQVDHKQIEKLMSVSLRDEVAAANNTWVAQVWYLREVTPPLVDLSQRPAGVSPTEVVDLGLSCFVIMNGLGARKGKLFHGVWGQDFLLDNVNLIDMVCTAALSYLEVICLPRDKMIKLLSIPKHEVNMHRAEGQCVYTIRRASSRSAPRLAETRARSGASPRRRRVGYPAIGRACGRPS